MFAKARGTFALGWPARQKRFSLKPPETPMDAPHAGPPAVPPIFTRSQPGLGAERRRAAFVKLANDRMTKTLDMIVLIGNLSNKNYRYYERDWRAMEVALHDAVDKAMAHFKNPRDEVPGFSLPEDEEEEGKA
jgi:hypothetical protein